MISYLFLIYILFIIFRHYFKILLIAFQYKTIIWTWDQKLILCFWNKFITSWPNILKSCVNMQMPCRHTQLVSATATGDSESGCSTAGGIVGPVLGRLRLPPEHLFSLAATFYTPETYSLANAVKQNVGPEQVRAMKNKLYFTMRVARAISVMSPHWFRKWV